MQKPTSSQNEIIEMFNKISSRYDLLNRLLSLGIDKRWRKIACADALSYLSGGELAICDVACGTGDMLLFWQKAAQKAGVKVSRFVGVDPAIAMLKIAQTKLDFADFIEGSATDIPLESSTQDIASISYGIRNVIDIDSALQEFYRILKPGGLLTILEFTRPQKNSLLQKAARFYVKKAIPLIGKLISNDKEAYTYLPSSIEFFLTKDELAAKLENTGFAVQQIKSHNFEISTTFIAKKEKP